MAPQTFEVKPGRWYEVTYHLGQMEVRRVDFWPDPKSFVNIVFEVNEDREIMVRYPNLRDGTKSELYVFNNWFRGVGAARVVLDLGCGEIILHLFTKE